MLCLDIIVGGMGIRSGVWMRTLEMRGAVMRLGRQLLVGSMLEGLRGKGVLGTFLGRLVCL